MEIEIKVLSCKGLTAFNFFQKLSIYATVSIKCDDQMLELTQHQKQEQKTSVDEQGDGNPEWNHTVTFDLRRFESIRSTFDNLSVVFEFRHKGQLFGDKIVGEVCVPVRILVDSVGIDVVRFVSYEVRSPDGKHNGILDFSYKIWNNNNNNSVLHSEIHVSGYIEQHHSNHTSSGMSSHVHVSEYHRFHSNQGEIIGHYHQKHHHFEQQSSSDPERVQYPRIDFQDLGSGSSALVSSGNQYYPPTTNTGHYPSHRPDVYPPRAEHQWPPLPQQAPHYPPPTPQYGDPHWGYYRPPQGNQPNGGYHRW